MYGLQSTAPDRQWLLGPTKGDVKPADVVLYLGRNVLRTIHVNRTVIDIFKLVDVNIITVGGSAYCRGSQHAQNDDDQSAKAVASPTVRKFEPFHPERVVMWCPLRRLL